MDVMRPYRRLIDDALTSVAEHLPSAAVKSVHSPPVLGSNDTSAFNELLDTWKSGALQLAVQLNAVTFALQGAHRRLLSCAQGVGHDRVRAQIHYRVLHSSEPFAVIQAHRGGREGALEACGALALVHGLHRFFPW